MHPIFFHLGPLWIPTYGIFAAAALLTSMLLVRHYARLEGHDPSKVMDAIFWSIVAGLVGSRVLEAIINWERYFTSPGGLKLLVYSTGVFVGGLVSAIAVAAYLFHKIRLPALVGLDILAPVAALIEAIGRWGCFFSGCCWGTPTDLPWAVTFPEIARRLHAGLPDVPLHPTQIYLSLNAAAILLVLVYLYRRKRFHGHMILSYLFLYSFTRFFTEFVRGDAERGYVFGGLMSTSQFVCVLLATAAVVGYILLDLRHRRTHAPDWRPALAAAPAGAARTAGPVARKARRRR
ncbi:MAG: prolipoprotein diacylglyceryl transferase [Acidobacteria bacterium]|nr:prolipoprotein diacylglyceryl transferase [Acidobacteriota bacterium]